METTGSRNAPKPAYATLLLLGESFRPERGAFWLGELLDAAELVGVKARSMRTVVRRMTSEGWFAIERIGRRSRYRLSDAGRDELRRGDVRVFELDQPAWDGRWQLVLTGEGRGGATEPDGLAKPLRWLGFGRLGPGQWLSPHDRGAELGALARELDPGHRLAVFTDASFAGRERGLVDACWDLRGIAARYEAFLAAHRDAAAPPWDPPVEPVEAFRRLFWLDHDMLRILRDDPNLPAALLPEDWPGHEARRLFRVGRERYEPGSRELVERIRASHADLA
ncbi:MAG: PaaX family transcriptional regulator C-terminal domain-containing protein [Actinomycetota bacterium]|nr:PaaX family transcriptional regulator C-terminal domain-containing protein [Actinomycetota bacterium]